MVAEDFLSNQQVRQLLDGVVGHDPSGVEILENDVPVGEVDEIPALARWFPPMRPSRLTTRRRGPRFASYFRSSSSALPAVLGREPRKRPGHVGMPDLVED
jgi:hypothetical protein